MEMTTVIKSDIDPSSETGPVFTLHCSASSGRQWDGLARSLHGHCRVVAPDLFGYGDAGPWSGPGPLSLSAEAAHAAAALPEDGARPCHVVGHSYGGAVALRFALEQPHRVASLTLIEPVAFHVLRSGSPRDRRLLGSVRRVAGGVTEGVLSGDYQAAMARFVDYWNGDGAWEATPAESQRRFSRHAPKVVLDFHAAVNESTALEAYRSAFRFPVRILRGERSPEPARRVAEMLCEHIDGARLTTVPGAGHMLPLTHPAQMHAAVVAQIDTMPEYGRQAA